MVKRIKVLHVISNFGVGGVEMWLIALLRYLKEFESSLPVKIEIDVFMTNGVTSVLDDEAARLGARLIYSRYSRSTLFRFISDWRRCLIHGDYDVIHDHQEFTAGWHFLMGLGKLPKIRIVHLHNPLSHQKAYSNSLLRRFIIFFGNRLVSKLATHCLSTSKQLMIEQGFHSRIFRSLEKYVAHCGFDTRRFIGSHNKNKIELEREFGLSSGSRIMLFVGRLDSHVTEKLNQKNPMFCLEVARICANRDHRYYCLMAGHGGKEVFKLREKVEEWGLSNRILFLGSRNDIPRLMLGSNLLLLPSIAEGLGMVAVEAQAAGLCVLASQAVPSECVVVQSLVSFLPLTDGPVAWAELVLRKLTDTRPEVVDANIRVKNSGFSIESSTAKLIEIYS